LKVKNAIRDLFESKSGEAQFVMTPEFQKMGVMEFLETRPQREGTCPVRNIKTTEYALPVSLLTHEDERSQNREGTVTREVAQKKRQMLKPDGMGQTTGICVFVDRFKDDGVFPPVWGNHRAQAAEAIHAQGDKITNCPKGCIWVTPYDDDISLYRFYQIKENNDRPRCFDATDKNNFVSISNMVAAGNLDKLDQIIFGIKNSEDGRSWKFKEEGKMADVGENERRRRLGRALETMGVTSTKTIIDRWCSHTGNLAKTFSQNKHQMQRKFNGTVGRDYDIKIEIGKSVGTSQPFQIIDDGKEKTVCMFFIDEGVGGSAYGQMAHQARNIDGKADEIWCCVSVPVTSLGKSTKDLDAYRQKHIAWAERWNRSVKSEMVFDRYYFPPQSKKEKESMSREGFIREHIFQKEN